MSTRDFVLARVEAFIAERGISARQFSLNAIGDHRLVTRLRSGAGVTLTLIERAEAYMDGVEAGRLPLHPAPPSTPSEDPPAPPSPPAGEKPPRWKLAGTEAGAPGKAA